MPRHLDTDAPWLRKLKPIDPGSDEAEQVKRDFGVTGRTR